MAQQQQSGFGNDPEQAKKGRKSNKQQQQSADSNAQQGGSHDSSPGPDNAFTNDRHESEWQRERQKYRSDV